jgi:DNA (cytosine-5)-methyltransferase 1
MLTAESSINRSSHIILDNIKNSYRVLTPDECEKLNEFPFGWTNTGMPEKFRYFTMGNALVVGLIRKVAKVLKDNSKI